MTGEELPKSGSRLAVVSSLKKYLAVAERRPDIAESTTLTADTELICFLEKEDRKYISLWDYLTPDEIHRNELFLRRLVDTWYDQFFRKNEILERVHFFKTLSQDLVYPIRAILNTTTALKNVFHQIAFDEILYSESRKYSLTGLRKYSDTDILDSCVSSVIHSEKLDVRGETYSYEGEDRAKGSKSTRKAKRERKLSDGLNRFEPKDGRPRFLFLINPDNFDKEIFLVNEICEDERLDVYLFWNHNTVLSGEENGRDINFLLDFFWETDDYIEWGKIVEEGRKKIASAGFLLESSEFQLLYKDFKFIIDQFFLGVHRTLKVLNATIRLVGHIRPNMVFIGDSWSSISNLISSAVKNYLGLPTAAVSHNAIGTENLHYERRFDCTYYFVEGNDTKAGLEKFPANRATEVIPTGTIRGDRIKNSVSHSNGPAARKTNRDILIMTSQYLGLGAPILNEGKNVKSLRQLDALANRRRDLKFYLKPHPSDLDFFYLYSEILGGNSNIEIIDRYSSLASVLEGKEIAVLFNTPSNAGLDAALSNVPVIYYKEAVYDIPEADSVYDRTTTTVAGNIDELEKGIDMLLALPQYQRQDLCLNLLNVAYSNSEVSSSRAIGKILYEGKSPDETPLGNDPLFDYLRDLSTSMKHNLNREIDGHGHLDLDSARIQSYLVHMIEMYRDVITVETGLGSLLYLRLIFLLKKTCNVGIDFQVFLRLVAKDLGRSSIYRSSPFLHRHGKKLKMLLNHN